MKKQVKDLAMLLAGMAAWTLGLFVTGVVARINWEIFMYGWNSL